MTTQNRITANRANAQHSTGPKSEEGKSVSSKNSTSHGLTAAGLIIPPGQETAFSDLESGLRASLQPASPLQELLFNRIIESSWNLHRCRLAESQLYANAGEIDPLFDDQHAVQFARIQRYARKYESSMYKAMRELSNVQTESQYRLTACPVSSEPINPHTVSELCRLEKVVTTYTRQLGVELHNAQLETRHSDRVYLDRITTPEPFDSFSAKNPSVVD